jgi:hypothetical protein
MATLKNSTYYSNLDSSRKFMSAAIHSNGQTAFSFVAGTLTETGTRATTTGVNPTGTRFITAASIGAAAGINTSSFALVRSVHNAIFECWSGNAVATRFEDARTWIGLHSATPTNATGAGNTHISFRYADLDGDGGWIGSVNDGTTQTTTGTVGSYATDSRLRIRIDSVNSLAYFSVNNGTESSLSISTVSTTQNFGMLTMIVTTVAANKDVILSRMTLETD